MTTHEVINAYFRAVNAEDWTQLESVMTADASYQSTGARPRSGGPDVIDFFRGAFKAWTARDDSPTNLIVDGDGAAVEVTFTGTTADGRVLSFEAIDIFKLHDGKIRSCATWYDLGAVRKLLAGTA